MSSRVIRPEDRRRISSHRLARDRSLHHADARIEQRRSPGIARRRKFSRKPRLAARAAYQQGLAAGEAAAQQRAQQKLDPVLHGLNAMIAELAACENAFAPKPRTTP